MKKLFSFVSVLTIYATVLGMLSVRGMGCENHYDSNLDEQRSALEQKNVTKLISSGI